VDCGFKNGCKNILSAADHEWPNTYEPHVVELESAYSRGVLLLGCFAQGFQRSLRSAPTNNLQFHIS
jgi:hypothetical protein